MSGAIASGERAPSGPPPAAERGGRVKQALNTAKEVARHIPGLNRVSAFVKSKVMRQPGDAANSLLQAISPEQAAPAQGDQTADTAARDAEFARAQAEANASGNTQVARVFATDGSETQYLVNPTATDVPPAVNPSTLNKTGAMETPAQAPGGKRGAQATGTQEAAQPTPETMTFDQKVELVHNLYEAEQQQGGGPLTTVLERMTTVYNRDPLTLAAKYLKPEDGPQSKLEWKAVALQSSAEGLVDFLGDMSDIKTSDQLVNALVNRVDSLTAQVAQGEDAKGFFESPDDTRRTLKGVQWGLRALSRHPDEDVSARFKKASKDLYKFRKQGRYTFFQQLQDNLPVLAEAVLAA